MVRQQVLGYGTSIGLGVIQPQQISGYVTATSLQVIVYQRVLGFYYM
jgi:hypothetical protein